VSYVCAECGAPIEIREVEHPDWGCDGFSIHCPVNKDGKCSPHPNGDLLNFDQLRRVASESQPPHGEAS
jgi:hypothetical protein